MMQEGDQFDAHVRKPLPVGFRHSGVQRPVAAPKQVLSDVPSSSHPCLPEIFDLTSFQKPLERNAAITQWYGEVDRILTEFMGSPDLPTWARFAQHASYNAGTQLRNIDEGLQAIQNARRVLNHFGDGLKQLSPKRIWQGLRAAPGALKEALDLLRYPGLLQEALSVSLIQAGVKESAMQGLQCPGGRGSIASTTRRYWLASTNIHRLLTSLPELEDNLLQLQRVVAESNADIYEFMAPRIGRFLSRITDRQAAVASEDTSDADTGRFLESALGLYEQAAKLSTLAHKTSDIDERLVIEEQRRDCVEQANLLATFGEQLFRVQPKFVEVESFLREAMRFMQFQFPDSQTAGAHPEVDRNWCHIYDRMGIDVSKAPADPMSIAPEDFPPLLPEEDPRFYGTIGQILRRGVRDENFARALSNTPPPIEPSVRHVIEFGED